MKRDYTFVDTGLLRDHVSKLQKQKKTALRLRENVVAMRNLSEPEDVYQYNLIIRDLDNIIEYFERMSRSLSHIADEATHLGRRINKIIEGGTERTRHAISESLQL